MSGQLDDLARALVTPTSRRRALRVLGSAALVAAFPGLRPGSALAKGKGLECPAGTRLCSNGKGSEVCVEAGGDCCIYPEAVVGCKAGTKCGGSINNACVDACANRCKDGKCCPRDKGRCVKGACCPLKRTTFAPRTNKKGVACCPPGTIAVPGETGFCCPKGDMNCCSGADDLAPLLNRGQLCVKGKVRKA